MLEAEIISNLNKKISTENDSKTYWQDIVSLNSPKTLKKRNYTYDAMGSSPYHLL